MKKLINFLPVFMLLFVSCSDDSSDDLPQEEVDSSVFTVDFHHQGDFDQFKEEITMYASYGWEDAETGNQVEAHLVSEENLPDSYTYDTKGKVPAVWFTYLVTPKNAGGEFSMETTFKIYQDGELIDTRELSFDNETTTTKGEEFTYAADPELDI